MKISYQRHRILYKETKVNFLVFQGQSLAQPWATLGITLSW